MNKKIKQIFALKSGLQNTFPKNGLVFQAKLIKTE